MQRKLYKKKTISINKNQINTKLLKFSKKTIDKVNKNQYNEYTNIVIARLLLGETSAKSEEIYIRKPLAFKQGDLHQENPCL